MGLTAPPPRCLWVTGCTRTAGGQVIPPHQDGQGKAAGQGERVVRRCGGSGQCSIPWGWAAAAAASTGRQRQAAAPEAALRSLATMTTQPARMLRLLPLTRSVKQRCGGLWRATGRQAAAPLEQPMQGGGGLPVAPPPAAVAAAALPWHPSLPPRRMHQLRLVPPPGLRMPPWLCVLSRAPLAPPGARGLQRWQPPGDLAPRPTATQPRGRSPHRRRWRCPPRATRQTASPQRPPEGPAADQGAESSRRRRRSRPDRGMLQRRMHSRRWRHLHWRLGRPTTPPGKVRRGRRPRRPRERQPSPSDTWSMRCRGGLRAAQDPPP